MYQLWKFFSHAMRYVSPDEASLQAAGSEGFKHAALHRRIVRIAITCACCGASFGIACLVLTARAGHLRPAAANQIEQSGAVLLFSPFMFAAAGLIFGTALGCLFAPNNFLRGPVGQRWMQLIGTQSMFATRLVCLLFSLFLLAFMGLMAWALWMDMQGL